MKRNKDSLRGLWNNIKCTNIHIIGVSEEERENNPEKIFEEIIAENFPNMGKEIVKSSLGSADSPRKDKPKGEHIIKLTKTKDKDKLLKATREKRQYTREIP